MGWEEYDGDIDVFLRELEKEVDEYLQKISKEDRTSHKEAIMKWLEYDLGEAPERYIDTGV